MRRFLSLLLALLYVLSLCACPAPAPETGGSTTTTTSGSGSGSSLSSTTSGSGSGGGTPSAPLTLTAASAYALVGEQIALTAGGTEGKSVSFTAPDGSVSSSAADGVTYTATAATAGVHSFTVTDGTRTASCAVTVFSAEETIFSASDTSIRILGRTNAFGNGRVELRNTASGFEVTFYGTALSVTLENAAGQSDTAKFAVYVDGEGDPAVDQVDLSRDGATVDGRRVIEICRFAEAGLHTVRLQKITQEALAVAIFFDVRVEGGLLPTEPDEALRLMIYGDSITCGHSNMRPDGASDTWSSAKENGMLTYAMRTAAMLDADAHVFARSGLGLYTNPYGSSVLLKNIFNKTAPLSPYTWDMQSWIPDAIVIGIGTNDVWTTAGTGANAAYTKDAFVEAYMDFVHDLVDVWGDDKAFFLCTSMMTPAIDDAVREVTTRLNNEEGLFVYFVDLPAQSNPSGHPDNASHIAAADVLYNAIASRMGLN